MGKQLKRVCLTPRVSGVGGMVTFSEKLAEGLSKRGVGVSYDLDDETCESVLVIGGTRKIGSLNRTKQRGIPVVQRLDGMNWLHRRTRTGILHWLRAERGNRVLATIRSQVATGVVYQSNFVKEWWQREHGIGPESVVVHNGVDLNLFNPDGQEKPPSSHVRILMVEGNLGGGYELGLDSAMGLCNILQKKLNQVELVVAGNVDTRTKEKWQGKYGIRIEWLGVLSKEKLPSLYRSAHLLYSGDLNAACPNSVIEALACGLPVLAFDTGALSELVMGHAGRVVPYGGDPWKLDRPDVQSLAVAAAEIFEDQEEFRTAARALAEKSFGLDKMVEAYIGALSA